MTAPNVSSATPGQRFTDPDGGTWVRLSDTYTRTWLQVTLSGAHYWRSQEEAEAAGLELLHAASDFEAMGWERVVDELAVPAPLDPGNPEHLRQVADFIEAVNVAVDAKPYAVSAIGPSGLRSFAERRDRERDEAEREAADRKRAESHANTLPFGRNGAIWPTARDAYLAGIRAERARQEAGQ